MLRLRNALDDVEVWEVPKDVTARTAVKTSILDELMNFGVILDVAIGRVEGNLAGPTNINHVGLKLAFPIDHHVP